MCWILSSLGPKNLEPTLRLQVRLQGVTESVFFNWKYWSQPALVPAEAWSQGMDNWILGPSLAHRTPYSAENSATLIRMSTRSTHVLSYYQGCLQSVVKALNVVFMATPNLWPSSKRSYLQSSPSISQAPFRTASISCVKNCDTTCQRDVDSAPPSQTSACIMSCIENIPQ